MGLCYTKRKNLADTFTCGGGGVSAVTIQIKLSVRQLGAELLRRLGGALLLFVGTFTVNAIPYLWPDVFWASGSGLLYRNLLGLRF